MKQGITFVGMDAHKVAITLAVLVPGETKPVEWQLSNENAAVRRMVRKVQRLTPSEVRFCYEAGPCGYALQPNAVSLKRRREGQPAEVVALADKAISPQPPLQPPPRQGQASIQGRRRCRSRARRLPSILPARGTGRHLRSSAL